VGGRWPPSTCSNAAAALDRRHPLRPEQRRPRHRGRASPAAGYRLSLIVHGLAERVRIIRTRVPASVETVARSLTPIPQPGHRRLRGGRSPVGRYPGRPAASTVLQLGVDPPGRSQVRQYRPPGAGEEHPPADRERPGPLRPRWSGPGQGCRRSRRWATALLTAPPAAGPPEHRSFRCVPSPCRFRRAPPVSPPEPLGRTAVNLAAGTGHRMCRRSQAGGDLRHIPGFRRAGGSASGYAAGWRRSHRR
jgi:hypothetical protein